MTPHHLSNSNLIDQLRTMQHQEQTHYKCGVDYLNLPSPFLGAAGVTIEEREAMCRWAYEIVDACQVDRAIACIGITYFDRFMCTSSMRAKSALISRREFQMAFISCLILALKYHTYLAVDADIISQRLYNQQEIYETEKEILCALNWRMNGPSPHDFIHYFLLLLPSTKLSIPNLIPSLTEIAEVQSEIAMLDYAMALQPPSHVAISSVLAALKHMSTEMFHPIDRLAFLETLALITGVEYDGTTIEAIQERLVMMVPEDTFSKRRSIDMVNLFDDQ